jgi:hypothetical protein
LQQLLNNPLLMAVGGRMTPIALPVYRLIRRLNTENVERVSITPETRQRLQQQFMPEVGKLSSLLGRDLTYWCRD